MKDFEIREVLKEELSKIEVTRVIWYDFDVCRKYRSDPWMKVHEKGEERHILGISG